MTQPTDQPNIEADLTDKQEAFVLAYLGNGYNGVQAARTAGYKGSYNTLSVTAHDNIRNPKIAARIKAHMEERAMAAFEVLARLGEEARTDMRELMNLTPAQLKKHPMAAHIKKIKRHITSSKDGEKYETIEIELYDAQAAKRLIGQQLKLFNERMELANADGKELVVRVVYDDEHRD